MRHWDRKNFIAGTTKQPNMMKMTIEEKAEKKNCRNGRKLKFIFSACNLWPRKIDYHQSVNSDLGSAPQFAAYAAYMFPLPLPPPSSMPRMNHQETMKQKKRNRLVRWFLWVAGRESILQIDRHQKHGLA